MNHINLKVLIPTVIAALVIGILAGKFIFAVDSHDQMDMTATDMASDNHDHQSTTPEEVIWTCSMHPQIRQNEPGVCPICEMDLIPLDSGPGNQDPTLLQMTENAVRLAQIATVRIGSGQINAGSGATISVDGAVQLDERLIKSQTSHLGGRIESLTVNFEGDYVKAGQKIGSLYSPELLTASKELLTAIKFENNISGVREATIRKLKNWKISDAQIQDIITRGEAIETIDLVADHSGYVIRKMVSQGDYIAQGGVLFTLAQTGNVWLFFNVFESDLASVRTGQTIQFTTPSLPGRILEARISYIDPVLDPSSRTARVRASASGLGNLLKPGMLLKGTIQEAPRSSNRPLTVPKSAVLWTGKTSVVYVQLEEEAIPTYQFREVVLGQANGQTFEVIKGLKDGDLVVTNGAFVIDASAQLNNQQSMMNKDVTLKSTKKDRYLDYKNVTPDEFRDQIEPMIDAYLAIKDALVATDARAAAEADIRLNASLDAIDMGLLTGDAHTYWMQLLPTIKLHAEKIQAATDIEEQRRQFDFLSQQVIKVVRAFGVDSATVFIQYCPMAINNHGAEWISHEPVIRNPYFGDKMLTCGSVLDSVTVDMNVSEAPESPQTSLNPE